MSPTMMILIHVIGIALIFALGYHMGSKNR